MSNSFWNILLANLKNLITNIENELKKDVNLFLSVLGQIISAEEAALMNDALPIVKGIAINIQNTQPGLSAVDFIAAVIKASIPALEAEGLKLVNTALGIVASSVAHELTIPNTAGNAGVVS